MADNTLDLASLLRPRRTQPAAPANLPLPATTLEAPPEREESSKIVALENMKDRGTLLRFISFDDETGGSTSVWSQAGSYRLAVYKAGEPQEGQGESETPYRIEFPPEADVRPKDRLGVPGWFNQWQPNIPLQSGDKIIPATANGHYYVVDQAGVTGGVEPNGVDGDWPTAPGATIQNGTVRLREAGEAQFYELQGSDDGLTNAEKVVVKAKVLNYR